MKPGKSSLNVNAAVYVPLCKRATAGENHDHSLTAKGSESKNASVGFGSYPANTTANFHPSTASQNYRDHKNPTSGAYSWKRTDSNGSYASSSKSPKEVSQKELLDEDFDMDLLYLQMTFPELSDESLSHIYMVNSGDLESTVDMLNQLELFANDSHELLPDSLEIGDTSDSQSSKEDPSLKLKEVADDVAGSSGSSNQHPVQN